MRGLQNCLLTRELLSLPAHLLEGLLILLGSRQPRRFLERLLVHHLESRQPLSCRLGRHQTLLCGHHLLELLSLSSLHTYSE